MHCQFPRRPAGAVLDEPPSSWWRSRRSPRRQPPRRIARPCPGRRSAARRSSQRPTCRDPDAGRLLQGPGLDRPEAQLRDAPARRLERQAPLRRRRRLQRRHSRRLVAAGAERRATPQVSSDSGHQGNGLDASFALNDPLAAQLFGIALGADGDVGARSRSCNGAYGVAADEVLLRGLLERRARGADERAALPQPVRRRHRARARLQLGRLHGPVQPHRQGAGRARRRLQRGQDGDAGERACAPPATPGRHRRRRRLEPAACTLQSGDACAAPAAPTPATPACRTRSSRRSTSWTHAGLTGPAAPTPTPAGR